jgi:hypothetical protein
MKVLILAIFLVAACAGLAQTSQGHVVLSDVGLYEKPASYTELTFTNPGGLPSTLPKSSSAVQVSFSIRNVSGAARAYQWSVALTKAATTRVKAKGTVTALAQQSVNVTKSVTTACTSGRVEVQVRLASPAESVHFWVTCPPTTQRPK